MLNLLCDLERILSDLFPGKTNKPCFIAARRASARLIPSAAAKVVIGDLSTGRSSRTAGVEASLGMLHYKNIYGRSDPNAASAIAQGQIAGDYSGVALLAAGALIIARDAIGWLRFGYWAATPLSTFWFWVGGSPEIANLWLLQQSLTLVLFGLGMGLIFTDRIRS
jgi:hypothetical protein